MEKINLPLFGAFLNESNKDGTLYIGFDNINGLLKIYSKGSAGDYDEINQVNSPIGEIKLSLENKDNGKMYKYSGDDLDEDMEKFLKELEESSDRFDKEIKEILNKNNFS